MMVIMIGLLLLGFPMMVPLITGAVVGFVMMFDGFGQMGTFVQQMMGGIRPASLIAVPMFILAADIMTRGQSADRLIHMVMAFIGHIKGGLAISTATSCTLFGAVSGSTQATVVAVGSPLRPKLLKAGYSDSFSLALIINSSDIAFLIPPSIGFIIYGVISGTSIAELFIAGIGPGVMILMMFSIYCLIYAYNNKVPTEERAGWRERGVAVREALWPLFLPGHHCWWYLRRYFQPYGGRRCVRAVRLLTRIRGVPLAEIAGYLSDCQVHRPDYRCGFHTGCRGQRLFLDYLVCTDSTNNTGSSWRQ